MGGDLISMIIDTASALSAQRSIALSLIQSVAPSPSGTGGQIDLVA